MFLLGQLLVKLDLNFFAFDDFVIFLDNSYKCSLGCEDLILDRDFLTLLRLVSLEYEIAGRHFVESCLRRHRLESICSEGQLNLPFSDGVVLTLKSEGKIFEGISVDETV